MGVLSDVRDALKAKTGDTVAAAAGSALDAATARPLNVILSVDTPTRDWLTVLAVVVSVAGVLAVGLFRK